MAELGTLLVGFVVAVLLYLLYCKRKVSYWKDRGVKYVIDPGTELLGASLPLVLAQKPINELSVDRYNMYPDERFVGLFVTREPTLLIRDPDLIDTVLIKDFSNFTERGHTEDPKSNQLSMHLLNLGNDEWRALRNKLSPTFSSGKLKGMHSQLVDCSNLLIECMEKYKDGTEFELRDVVARFTTDVISSCAFGLDSNAIRDPDSKFRQIGKKVFSASRFRRILYIFFWKFARILRLPGIPPQRASHAGLPSEMTNFFIKTVDDTLEYREKNNIVRQDFLHSLNELRKKDEAALKAGDMAPEDKPLIITRDVVLSNAFVFFIAGFETTASTLSHALYQLSLHEDVQEKLYHEIMAALKRNNNELTYETLQDVKFMEEVISETLRLHPPPAEITRKVHKPYTIPGTDVVLEKGLKVVIPFYAIHHDPKYFPDPEEFRPSRFSPENQANIRRGTFHPFGDGPRNCIAVRFARMEIKVALIQILRHYKVMRCSKTRDPLKYDRTTFSLSPEGGIWVSISPRT